MGAFLKYVLRLVASIMWQRMGGTGAIPPVRFKGKKPVDIPVVAPWQTVVVMWAARKMWAAFGGQIKDVLASSPNGAAQHLGSILPKAPAKTKKPAAPKAAPPAPGTSVLAPRAPQTWAGTAQPAATPAPPSPPAPQAAAPAAPPAAPRPVSRSIPNYATRQPDDQDSAPVNAPDASVAPPPAPAPAAPVAVPPTPVASSASPASKLRPGSLLSSLRRRS